MTICYFGIYPPKIARNAVLARGLRENGINIIECVDSSKFLLKFWRLFIKHWKIRNDYDVLLAGYFSNLILPLAWLITHKKIIYNAGHSMYESMILDRKKHGKYSIFALLYWIMDFLAFSLADLVLIESDEQKKFIIKKFQIKEQKLIKSYIGADDNLFYPEPIKKREKFTVVFRGIFLPFVGVEYIIEAANILRNNDIDFLIIGKGPMQAKIKKMIKDFKLENIKIIDHYLPWDELRQTILSCHAMLGQFSNQPRIERTIQNKTFEALALGMPYITYGSKSNQEILKDRENCLFVNPTDSQDLAQKILEFKNNPKLGNKIAKNGYSLFKNKLTPKALAKDLISGIKNI